MLINRDNLKVNINENNIKIINSYRINNKKEMKEILTEIFERDPYKDVRTRKIDESILEWKTHNILYNLHLFRTHTIDCDITENEQLHRMIIYQILGRL